MAWTAPRTWTTGELVTKAIMDTHIRDNENYLKTETDKLDDCVQTVTSNTKDTIYQNTTKFRFITICLYLTGASTADIQVASSTPPTTTVALISGTNAYEIVSFWVPPLYYYRVATTSGTPSINKWTEWDLH